MVPIAQNKWQRKISVYGSSKVFTKKDMIFLGKIRKHLYASYSTVVNDRDEEFMEIRIKNNKKSAKVEDSCKRSEKDGNSIKLRLRWKTDIFRFYHRNTTLLAGQNC
eukprot:487458-Ditylum_brightwellii.AAC.1